MLIFSLKNKSGRMLAFQLCVGGVLMGPLVCALTFCTGIRSVVPLLYVAFRTVKLALQVEALTNGLGTLPWRLRPRTA